jgi:hypothetical protein
LKSNTIKFESQEQSIFDRCWVICNPQTTAMRDQVKEGEKDRVGKEGETAERKG